MYVPRFALVAACQARGHCCCLCSALRDRRFEPVAHRELASLSCTVSLLFAFETAASWLDWAIGTHGLIIEFYGSLLSHAYASPCRNSCMPIPLQHHSCLYEVLHAMHFCIAHMHHCFACRGEVLQNTRMAVHWTCRLVPADAAHGKLNASCTRALQIQRRGASAARRSCRRWRATRAGARRRRSTRSSPNQAMAAPSRAACARA